MTIDAKSTHFLPFPILLRIGLIVTGILICWTVCWELWRGIFPLNALSLLFGVIFFCGLAIGLFAIGLAIFGQSRTASISESGIEVKHNGLFSNSKTFSSNQILKISEAKQQGFSEEQDYYIVRILIKDEKRPVDLFKFKTKKEAAEKAAFLSELFRK